MKPLIAAIAIVFSTCGALAETPPIPPVHPHLADWWKFEEALGEGFRLRPPMRGQRLGCPDAYDLVRGQGAWERDQRAFVSRWHGTGRSTDICL